MGIPGYGLEGGGLSLAPKGLPEEVFSWHIYRMSFSWSFLVAVWAGQ